MENHLKKRLLSGRPAYGPFVVTRGLDSTELIARAGYDFVMIDAEHGSMGEETAHLMSALIRAAGAEPMIRVTENQPHIIKRALETGVSGVMIPMVNSAEEAARAVESCKFPPRALVGRGQAGPVIS